MINNRYRKSQIMTSHTTAHAAQISCILYIDLDMHKSCTVVEIGKQPIRKRLKTPGSVLNVFFFKNQNRREILKILKNEVCDAFFPKHPVRAEPSPCYDDLNDIGPPTEAAESIRTRCVLHVYSIPKRHVNGTVPPYSPVSPITPSPHRRSTRRKTY